ncbi:hypothetical protein LSH36_942g01046 [Paralvinella palmiformis]|uniref:Mab-21-like HhH/H2TH-like domain-containing protein n=1 Tax=Paralvinella palmiformis TaxID=53620 RepID=A0AAD9IXJ5_9ANNE|nr:hypothetical protein LSH36_942g01046 [Paralvinella palmiformis]
MKLKNTMTIKRDLVSELNVCHTSFILDHFLPKWFVKRKVIQFSNGFLHFWRDFTNPTDLSNIIIAGSVSDAVYIPDSRPRQHDGSDIWVKHYDVDILYIADVLVGYDRHEPIQYVIDTSNTYPGYFRLRPRPDSVLSSGLEENEWPDFVKDILSKKQTEVRYVILDGDESCGTYGICRSTLKNAGYKQCGPAFTDDSDELSVDLVTTGKCICWPPEADEFFTRTSLSGWPSETMKHKILCQGCHFVSKAHSASPYPELEYRFSFIMAEKMLLASLPLAQRQCFIIFKILVKDAIAPYTAITSYCLKTTLFWTLERIPTRLWTDAIHGLATGFLGLLDILIKFLASFCIPHYFIPENNLLAFVSKEHIKGSLRKLLKLRHHPIDILVKFDEMREFQGKCLEPMSVQLKETIDQMGMKFKQNTVEECLVLHLADTYSCLRHSISQKDFPTVLGLMDMFRCYEIINNSPQTHFLSLVEKELDSITETTSFGEMVDFLALLASIVYQKELDGPRCPEGQCFVDEAFKKALTNEHDNGLTHLYYGMFLLQCNKCDQAMSCFREALQFYNSDSMVCEYFSELRGTLNGILDQLLSKYDIISADCFAVCYHFMIEILIQKKQEEEAWKLIMEFEKRKSHFVPFCKHINKMLLAFAYMMVGEHWNAALTFDSDEIFEERISKLSISYADICRLVYLYDVFCQLIIHGLIADIEDM